MTDLDRSRPQSGPPLVSAAHAWTLALALLSAQPAACTLALGYPTPASSEIDCTNGIDDDFNGRTDCADLACDGQCPESPIATCTDARDNDGDGLTDAADPGCWPHLRVVPHARCATVGPTPAWTTTFAAADWTAPPRVVMHTLGGSTVPAVAVESGDDLVSTEVIAGDVEGLYLTVSVDVVGCPASRLQVGLARASTALDPRGGTRDGILVELDSFDGAMRTSSGSFAIAGVRVPSFAIGAPFRMIERVMAGHLVGTIGLNLPNDATLHSALATLPRDVPFRFIVSASGASGGGQWIVGELSASRVAFQPCGHDVPQLASPVVALAALPDGSLCALTEIAEGTGTRLVAQRSIDGVAWTATGGELHDASTLGGGTLRAAHDGTLVGAVLRTSARATSIDGSDVILISSPDCVTWSATETGLSGVLPPAISPRAVGLDVNPTRTRVTLVLRDPPALLDAVSTHFGPSFVIHAADLLPSSGPLRDGLPLGLRPLTIGNDRLVLASTAAGAALFLDAVDPTTGTRWIALGAPLVPPSNVDGTFDQTTIEGLALVPRMSSSHAVQLAIAYGGGPRGTCPACSYPSAITLIDLEP